MRSGLLLVAAAIAFAPGSTQAGPHLGMKLACKRYGEAWNSGSVRALQGVTTGDFFKQWSRMPASAFAKLPRGGTATVLSSEKGNGVGTVTVSTRGGVMTFVLVGGGFDWRVADIRRAGDDGRPVSVKEYLDVTLTASEFMEDLKYRGGLAFHDSISNRFQAAFHRLSPDELARIRSFLPEIERQKPHIEMDQYRAKMQVPLPGGSRSDRIIFTLVKQQGWKVDDYKVDAERIQIASFREALPVLASVTAFNAFCKNPRDCNAGCFTKQGALRDALCYASENQPTLFASSGERERFEISEDLRTVSVRQGGKHIEMKMAPVGDRYVIDGINIQQGERWMDVAQLLNLQRRVTGLGAAFANMLGVDQPAAVFANVVAETKTPVPSNRIAPSLAEKPADEPAIRSAVAHQKVEPIEKEKEAEKVLVPAVAETPAQSYYRYVQPAGYYAVHPQMSRKAYRHWRRSMRRCGSW